METSKYIKKDSKHYTEKSPDRYAIVENKATNISIENRHDMNHWFKTNAPQ